MFLTKKRNHAAHDLCSRLATLAVVILMAMPATAQMTIEEGSFKAYPPTNIMAVERENKHIDANGHNCALIRVITIEKNFEFDAGDFGIYGDPVYKTGEVWVWVAEEAPYLDISHPQFGKLTFKFPVEIESGRTYEMQLNPGNGRYVTITANRKARVSIDDQFVGETPVNNQFIHFGKHRIIGKFDRYEADTLFNVERGSGMLTLALNLIDQSRFFGKVNLRASRGVDI